MAKFKEEDCVKLTKDMEFSGLTIKKGTQGVVTKVYEMINSYDVEFVDIEGGKKVHENFLSHC
nr:hypothetical protein [uncultured Flavobacterium sp.]